MKFRTIQILSILIILLPGCNEFVDEVEILNKNENNFSLIRDGLYEDADGKLYHRTLDVSAIGNPPRDNYNDCLYVDSIVNGKETLHTPYISDVIDKETFHLVSVDSAGPGLRVDHYKDKNNTYFLLVVADGGTLHLSVPQHR